MTALIIGVVLALAVLSAASSTARPTFSRFTKMAASTLVVLLMVGGVGEWSAYAALVLMALLASWIGDLSLSFPSTSAFRTGLVAFASAHVAYTAAFVSRGMALPWLIVGAAAMTAVGWTILTWLEPHRPDALALPLRAYVVVISVMVATAVGTIGVDPDLRIPLGAAAFAGSDVLVARQRFVAPSPVNRLVGLPLYFAAQVLLALSAR